mmetsp:Transcript_33289/g.72655  ORF Transcript_33289/g.72655 Transcript_33289/m.72655 type:complete len:221 (-) Transcript_33289:72-734(-)
MMTGMFAGGGQSGTGQLRTPTYRKERNDEDENPKNAKGGILIKKETMDSIWRFLCQCRDPQKEIQDDEKIPESLPIGHIKHVMGGFFRNLTLKETAWLLGLPPTSRGDTLVSCEQFYNLVKDNSESAFAPSAAAFKELRVVTAGRERDGISKDNLVDLEKLREAFTHIGVEGVTSSIMKKVTVQLLEELDATEKDKDKARITFDYFQKLCDVRPVLADDS